MLFNNFASFARFGFFKTRFGFFSQRVSGNPAVANILIPKGKNCSMASEVNDRFATNQNDIIVELLYNRFNNQTPLP